MWISTWFLTNSEWYKNSPYWDSIFGLHKISFFIFYFAFIFLLHPSSSIQPATATQPHQQNTHQNSQKLQQHNGKRRRRNQKSLRRSIPERKEKKQKHSRRGEHTEIFNHYRRNSIKKAMTTTHGHGETFIFINHNAHDYDT